MNLLLLKPSELDGPTIELNERRAHHLISVLKVSPGDQLRTGIVGVGSILARVDTVGPSSVMLKLGEVTPAPPPTTHVVLAIPRPKALSRIVQCVSSFGAASITLTNAWKVEKSYLSSPRLSAERLQTDALLGCEQGRQCHPPLIKVFRRLTEFLEQSPAPSHQALKCVLDPEAQEELNSTLNKAPSLATDDVATVFVVGPDGGFIPREIETFADRGYLGTRINVGPLRTEVAVAAMLGIYSVSSRYVPSHLL